MVFMRREFCRSLAIATLAVFVGGCNLSSIGIGAPPSAPAGPSPATPVNGGRADVMWDTYGVPHIFAQDIDAAAFAFGWSQMRAHGDLLLQLYAQARGESASLWGPGFAASDRWVLTNDIPERAAEWLAQQEPSERAILDAFVAGINAYAKAHPDSLNPANLPVLPARPSDVLAHVQRVLHFTFVTDPYSVMGTAQRWGATPPGSNAWAVAPSKSATGNAMLLANPHTPWGDMFTWFEAQLKTPETDSYGAAFVGFPLLSIAFNDSLGWTHTVNTMDGADLYELTLRDNGYRFDGVVRPFELKQKVLRVKQADGTITEQPFTVPHSVHGPVIGQQAGKALALRVTGLNAPHLVLQTWEMLRARNRAEFESAISRLQLPMFTIMYADNRGSIMHVFNGRIPARPRGTYEDWRGIVRGDSSSTLWTNTLTYDRLPRLLNPSTGWLQNANDGPWTTTLPIQLDEKRFPMHLAPRPFMSLRAIRSARMISEATTLTLDEMIELKHSTRSEEADHMLEDLIAAARRTGTPLAREAAGILEAWDRNFDGGSRGAVLFLEFARDFNRRAASGQRAFDAQWTIRAPLATPDGIADAAGAARMLDAAAQRVRARYGRLDVPWGETHRLRRDSVDLPANGGPGELGIFRVVDYDSTSATSWTAVDGDSWVAAIEFARPVRARAVLGYGNWSQPGSLHRTDQLQLFARKELRPVWRTPAEIEANLVARERI
jgi:acyl-homoserine-lactone acylase